MTLNYLLEGAGPSVLLLHPVGLDLTCWNGVATRLSSKFRILRVDLRGHGNSPPSDTSMELSDYAADVHDLIVQQKLGPMGVVGLSFGGMVAQAFALDYPEKVASLVVAGCPCTLPASARDALSARGHSAIEHGMASQVVETLERWFTPNFIASGGAEAIRKRLLETDPRSWNNAWQAISHIDTGPRLNVIDTPTLCIAGALDPASPPAVLGEIAKRIRGSRLLILPSTPHMMQIECSELFAAAVEEFLARPFVGNAA